MGVKRQHLERKLQILRLPDELLCLVETHQLSERQLREILAKSKPLWRQLVHFSIEHDLTGPELAQFTEGKLEDSLIKILERRKGLLDDEDDCSDLSEPKKTQRSAATPEQQIQKCLVSFSKFYQRTSQSSNGDEGVEKLVDTLIQSGDHQVVLNSLELLVERLKTRVGELSV
ncbi:MAG: hypothetical protein H8D34_23740 [Chloroflexi bacterium]|nr:hypothetical protein [Chloroflexota bacterium]